MDVGLNNINRLHEVLVNQYLEDVEWIIEATDDERYNLWKEYKDKNHWQEVSSGNRYTILYMDVSIDGKEKDTLPVNINFNYAIINGHKILFYNSSSLLVHHGYIEGFMTYYFQRTHDNYSRWNHTNSTNFHNCINYLDTIDIETRDTKYTNADRYYKYWKQKDKGLIRKRKIKKLRNSIKFVG